MRLFHAGATCLILLAPTAASAQPPNPATRAEGTATAATAATAAATEYRISRGDKLRVEVYKDDHLSQSVQVRPDGRITLPLIGDLPAAGLSSTALREHISAALREYVSNPVVTVIVVEATEPVVYVMGEVNQPGSIPLRGPMTVLQALAVAGGFKEFADARDIRILRRTDGSANVETIPFDYKEAIKARGPVVFLREGDTVVVP